MTTWKSLLATSRNASSEDDVDESLPNSGLFTYPSCPSWRRSATARRTDTRSL
ncbi:hypothetical protein EDD16DRAFT_1666711 [Pisolithus croceorrhizus]|nr:hypothetical protein EDD16DRAFT_1666711 [Pisolithus croceorrhizus]